MGHTTQQQQSYRQLRAQVLKDHPGLKLDSTSSQHAARDPLGLKGNPLRTHPLWAAYASQGAREPSMIEDSPQPGVTKQEQEEQVDVLLPDSPSQSAFGPSYLPDEQTLRPDHSWNYAATNLGQLPADAVRNTSLKGRFDEYPKLRRLLDEKQRLVDQYAAPATYLAVDLRDSLSSPPLHSSSQASSSTSTVAASSSASSSTQPPFHLASLMPVKFDVVIIDAPLESYEWTSIPSSNNAQSQQTWSWEQISELPIPLLAAKESFVFLWVGAGSTDGLEKGRETLTRWGYRRCEVITWCLTNEDDPRSTLTTLTTGEGDVLATSAVHLLVGIRGTVRRNQDGNFVHCNIDTDVLMWNGREEEIDQDISSNSNPPIVDLRRKPPEVYNIIEHFCQGTRRIELFGTNRNIRRGWLTIGLPGTLGPDAPGWTQVLRGENAGAAKRTRHSADDIEPESYVKERYNSYFKVDPIGCPLRERRNVIPYDETVEALRPKTPPPTYGGLRDVNELSLDGLALQDTVSSNRSRSTTTTNSLPRGLGGGKRNNSNSPQHVYRTTAVNPAPSLPSSMRNDFPPPPTSSFPAFVLHPPDAVASTFLGMPSPSLNASNQLASRSPTAGLGAGGPVTVSLYSGSEVLSGPQASALGLGQQQQQLAAAAQSQGSNAVQNSTEDSPRARGGGGSSSRGHQGPRRGGRGRGGSHRGGNRNAPR